MSFCVSRLRLTLLLSGCKQRELQKCGQHLWPCIESNPVWIYTQLSWCKTSGGLLLLVYVHQDLILPSSSHWYQQDSSFNIRDSGCFVLYHLFNIPWTAQFLFLMLTQAVKTKAWLVLSGKENLAHGKYQGLMLIPSLFYSRISHCLQRN